MIFFYLHLYTKFIYLSLYLLIYTFYLCSYWYILSLSFYLDVLSSVCLPKVILFFLISKKILWLILILIFCEKKIHGGWKLRFFIIFILTLPFIFFWIFPNVYLSFFFVLFLHGFLPTSYTRIQIYIYIYICVYIYTNTHLYFCFCIYADGIGFM